MTKDAKLKDLSLPPDFEWPNTVRTREELDAAIQAGIDSGISDDTIETILARALERARNV